MILFRSCSLGGAEIPFLLFDLNQTIKTKTKTIFFVRSLSRSLNILRLLQFPFQNPSPPFLSLKKKKKKPNDITVWKRYSQVRKFREELILNFKIDLPQIPPKDFMSERKRGWECDNSGSSFLLFFSQRSV